MMSRLGDIGGRLYRGEVSLNFVGRQRMWYAISGVILLISVVALLVRGLDFSVDFKGGAIFQFRAPASSLSQVQNAVADAGVDGALVQHTTQGSQAGWQVQTKPLTGAEAVKVGNSIASHLDINSNSITTNTVGASWGSQITTKAIEALIAFLIVVVLYLSIAFEWKMAVSAFVALLHDLVIATGVYALAGFQVSPASVIGLLTILGYSLYDTVVVFDKVRENTAGLLGGARTTYSQAANLALNQTLVRSINTSVIALLPVAAILVVAIAVLGKGNELEDLALVLFVGMLSGTYSSICIATPVLADLKEREPQYRALAKRVATRAAGGRAAKRATAKAQPAGVSATSAPLPGEQADEAEDTAPPSDELTTTTASRMPTSSVRPGPRQQPRRSGGPARHRPAGKKKRR
jgi:preprotein translocase subunit SecF